MPKHESPKSLPESVAVSLANEIENKIIEYMDANSEYSLPRDEAKAMVQVADYILRNWG